MLNTYQQTKYNDFWDAINTGGRLFFNAKPRQAGKTYLINEIGLELQAFGYKVLVVSALLNLPLGKFSRAVERPPFLF